MKTNTFITLSTATANIGVLVGLVFLIFELRQTSAIALSEIRQERTLSIIDEYAMFAQNRQFTSMLHKALEDGDFDSLSKDDWNQVRLYETARMVRLEDVFFQYHNGLIDDSAYDFSLAMAASRLPFWKWLKVAAFNPDFKERLMPSPRGLISSRLCWRWNFRNGPKKTQVLSEESGLLPSMNKATASYPKNLS